MSRDEKYFIFNNAQISDISISDRGFYVICFSLRVECAFFETYREGVEVTCRRQNNLEVVTPKNFSEKWQR